MINRFRNGILNGVQIEVFYQVILLFIETGHTTIKVAYPGKNKIKKSFFNLSPSPNTKSNMYLLSAHYNLRFKYLLKFLFRKNNRIRIIIQEK
jgi:hypothetical protein